MDDTIFNTAAQDGAVDVSDVFQNVGGTWARVSPTNPIPPTEEVNNQNQNVDNCLPVKVMKLFGLPEPYRRSLYTGIVEEVQEIKSFPSRTALTVYNMFSWICGRSEVPLSQLKTTDTMKVEEVEEEVEEEVKDSKDSSDSTSARPGSSIETSFKLSLTNFTDEKKSDDSVCIRLPSLLSFTPSRLITSANEEATPVYSSEILQDDSKLSSENILTVLTLPGSTIQTPVKLSPTDYADEKKTENNLGKRLPSILSSTPSRFTFNGEKTTTVYPCYIVQDDSKFSSDSILTRPGSSIETPVKLSLTDYADEKTTEDNLSKRRPSILSSTPSRFTFNGEKTTTVYPCNIVQDDSKFPSDSILTRPASSIETSFKLSLTDFADEKKSDDSICIRLPSLLSFTPSRFTLDIEEATSVCDCASTQSKSANELHSEVKLTSEKKVTFAGPEIETTGGSVQQFQPRGLEWLGEVRDNDINDNIRVSSFREAMEKKKSSKDDKPKEPFTLEKAARLSRPKSETVVSAQQLSEGIELAKNLKETDLNQNEVISPQPKTSPDVINEQPTEPAVVTNHDKPKGKFGDYVEESESSETETGTETSITESNESTSGTDLEFEVDPAERARFDYCYFCQRPTTRHSSLLGQISKSGLSPDNQRPAIRQASFLGQICNSKSALSPDNQRPAIRQASFLGQICNSKSALSPDNQRPAIRQASFLGQICYSKSGLYPGNQPPRTAPSLTSQDPKKFRAPVYIPKRPQSQPRNNLCRKIKMLERRNHPRIQCAELAFQNGGDYNSNKDPVHSQQKGAKRHTGRPQWQY